MRKLSFFLLSTFSLYSSSLLAEKDIQFNRDIRPILSDKCFHCHGFDANDRKADLRLDDEAAAKSDLGGYAAIVAGSPEKSEIMLRITSDDPDEVMPPPKHGQALSAEEIETLNTWIRQGAHYQTHWAFTKIEKPQAPSSTQAIDHFVQKQLKTKNLRPSKLAIASTQLRRASLDLTGLPPSLEELKRYQQDVQNLGQDEAYSQAIDRLLASPRYGERMAWQWLEASRYADTDGYQNDGPRTMWRWRDWVIQAYNQNMPFDQFSIEQLAGDLLPNPTHEQLIATAFNRNHRYNSESGIPIDEFLLENAVDRVDTTSTIWMGLTMACARCHDHKYDPLSQKDYYQLIDYFNDVAESGRAIKFGNSEPWIKSPLAHQRDTLEGYDKDIHKRHTNLFSSPRSTEQKEWETSDLSEITLLNSGLDHHHSFDASSNLIQPIVKKQNPKYTQGIFGQAIHVGPNQGVTLPSIDSLICNGRFTLAFWMKPDQVDSGAILSNETAGTTRKGQLVEFNKGHLRWNLISRWIAGVGMLETKDTFNKGEWVHIALTNDGTQRARGQKIYINGRETQVKVIHNTNSNKMGKTETPVHLGFSKHTQPWSGAIDDFRAYSQRTLSSSEVQLLALKQDLNTIAQIPNSKRTPVQNLALRHAFLATQNSKDYLQYYKAIATRTQYYDKLPTTMITEDLPQGRPSYVRNRGLYDQLGEKVTPNVPAALPPLPKDQKNDRLAFAKWLMSPEHPLTARVTVNRYWQLFFGRGLVKTAEDFGSQGEAPSHPELLDWLAATFIESDWDIKAILKTIMMSHTYRQSSALQASHLEKDPDNVYLARAPRLRLHGNALRDQALFLSGLLVEKRGGPSVYPYQPEGLWKEASNARYKMGQGEDLHRRSLYTYWKRTLAPPSMAILDTADREYCSVKPKFTNTPLQALTLMNDFTYVEAARSLGHDILSHGGLNDKSKVQYAFKKLTARPPNKQEQSALIKAYQNYRQSFKSAPEDAQKLIQLHQKNYKTQHDEIELATAMTFANVLLNLDELTTKN